MLSSTGAIGYRYTGKEFGNKQKRASWQIDPFGLNMAAWVHLFNPCIDIEVVQAEQKCHLGVTFRNFVK